VLPSLLLREELLRSGLLCGPRLLCRSGLLREALLLREVLQGPLLP
jgi:hypothetical protein